MLRSFQLFATFAAALGIAACNAGGSSVPATIGQAASEAHPIPQWQAQNLARRACPEAAHGEAQCEALIINKSPESKVFGWGPAILSQPMAFPRRAKVRDRSLQSSTTTTTPTSPPISPSTAGIMVCQRRSFTNTTRTGNKVTIPRAR